MAKGRVIAICIAPSAEGLLNDIFVPHPKRSRVLRSSLGMRLLLYVRKDSRLSDLFDIAVHPVLPQVYVLE